MKSNGEGKVCKVVVLQTNSEEKADPEHLAILKKILKKTDMDLKIWIYDNPKICETRDFEAECPYIDRMGTKTRFCDLRSTIIQALPPTRQEIYERRPSFNKTTPETRRVKKWILNNPRAQHHTFLAHYRKTELPQFIKFAEGINKRRFDDIKRLMKKRGQIESAIVMNEKFVKGFNINN